MNLLGVAPIDEVAAVMKAIAAADRLDAERAADAKARRDERESSRASRFRLRRGEQTRTFRVRDDGKIDVTSHDGPRSPYVTDTRSIEAARRDWAYLIERGFSRV